MYTWRTLEADAAFHKDTLVLRRSLNSSQYIHYLLVSKGIYEKSPDDRFVVRSRSLEDEEMEAYFVQVKAKLPSSTRNPLYTSIKEGSLLWDQVEGHSVARFDTDRFRNALRGSGFIIPEGIPGYVPTPVDFAACKYPERLNTENSPTSPNQATLERYGVSRNRTPKSARSNFELSLADNFLDGSSIMDESDTPYSFISKNSPATPSPPRTTPPPEEQREEETPLRAATPEHHRSPTRSRSSTPYAQEATRPNRGTEPTTPRTEENPEETSSTSTQEGLNPSDSRSSTPTPPEERSPNTLQTPQAMQPDASPPRVRPLTFEDRIRMIRFNPEANPDVQLDAVIQRLATLTARISNINRSITRDCERYTTGVPSILLQAPPIKTPQTAEYDDSFYEDANRIILEASMTLSHRCIIEQQRILKKNQEEFDALLEGIKPRTLTEREWEQVYNLANKRRTTAQPAPTITTDPATIRFLIPPNQEKNHHFIYPNPQVKRIYTTQGQRLAASNTTERNQRIQTDSDHPAHSPVRRPNRSRTRKESRQRIRPERSLRRHRDRSPDDHPNPPVTQKRNRSRADQPNRPRVDQPVRARADRPDRSRSRRHGTDHNVTRGQDRSLTRRPHQNTARDLSRQSRPGAHRSTRRDTSRRSRYDVERPRGTMAREIRQRDNTRPDRPPRFTTRRPINMDRSRSAHHGRPDEYRSRQSDRHPTRYRDHASPQRRNRSRRPPYQRDYTAPESHHRTHNRPTHETRAPYIRFVTEQPERRVTIRSQSGNYRAQDSSWRREQQPRTHDILRGGERQMGFRTGTRRVIYRRGGA